MGCLYFMQQFFDKIIDVLETCFKPPISESSKVYGFGLISKRSSHYSDRSSNSDFNKAPTNFNYDRRKSSSNILKQNISEKLSTRRNTVASNYLEKNDLKFLAIYNSWLIAISRGNNFGLGTLTCKLKFDIFSDILQVYIAEAKSLLAMNAERQCNPYLYISIYPGKFDVIKTKFIAKTKNPKFNETKVFSGIKEADLKKLTLNIKIFNFNMTNDSRIIGEVLYPLSLLAECENEGNKKEIIFEKNITPFKDITSFLGLLLVSLYLDINKEEFVVSIIKGKDLKAIDRNNLTNPYCILKLGTSVSKLGNKKTSIKYKTLNPIWNQSFKFQVTKKDFDNNLTLKIKVLDKDPVESNVIGEIIFSSEGSLNAAHHWNSMIDNKMKPVSEWHTLKSCN